MYQDLLIAFHSSGDRFKATVWRRQFPAGRQRRKQVAEYTLRGLPVDPSPDDLLQALRQALGEAPDYTV